MPISPIQEMMSRPAHTHIMSRPSLPKLPIHTEMMPTSTAVSPASPTVTSPTTSTRTLSTSPLTITSDDSMCGMRTLLFLLSTPRPSITRSQSEMSPTTHHTRHTTRSSVPMSPSSPTSLSRSSTLSHIDEMEMEMEEPPRDTSSPPPPTTSTSSDVCSIWSPFAAIARTFTCFRSALPLQPPTPPPPAPIPPAPIDEFVVLTASPLVLDPVSLPHGPTPITPLHTRDEQQSLRSLLKHSGHQTLHPIFRHLSLRTLGEELINQPAYLHLSGHGTHLADGTYVLAFEHDAHGSADLIDMDTLSRLVETSYGSGRGGAPKFVILSACYSEHAAHVFVKAGASHVVGVCATERISDTAARTFSKWIWTALLAGHTVKRAFEIACVHVDVAARPSSPAVVTSSPPLTSSVSMPLPSIQTIPEDSITPTSTSTSTPPPTSPPPSRPPPRSESSKFVLLPADGNHDVILFPSPRHIRTSSQTSNPTSLSSQPSHRKMISYDSSTLPTSSRSTRTASDVATPHHASITLPLFLRYTSTSPLQDRCLPTSRTPIITPNPSNSNLPALPDHLIGRECDIHRIIRTLATHRVVNVHGQAKLGKSCVAIGAAHYMAERGFFQDGCYFLSMTAQLVDEMSIVTNLCYVLGINTSISSLRRLLAMIKDWDILLILDDGSSHYSVALIVQIIRNTTRIKIISTSVQNQTLVLPSIHQSASITMGQVPIRQLSPNHCIQLIRVLCASHPQASPLVALNDRQILTLIHACHYSPYHIRLAIRAYQSKTAQQQQQQHDHMIDVSRISTSSDLQHEEISQHRISLSESTLVA